MFQNISPNLDANEKTGPERWFFGGKNVGDDSSYPVIIGTIFHKPFIRIPINQPVFQWKI